MRFCYFGIFDPNFGRNRVYISGLKLLGHEVTICNDTGKGFSKYYRLYKKHRELKNKYDVMVVGYPGYSVVWLAKILSNKPIVFDALCTKFEAQVLSRKIYPLFSFNRLLTWLEDRLSVLLADIVLVETSAQKKYFENKFNYISNKKIKVLMTGADEASYFRDSSVSKRSKFTVLFRGRFLAEAGIPYIIEAAKLLQDKDVDFIIVGSGHVEREVNEAIARFSPKNLVVDGGLLTGHELRNIMNSCHVSLGQFARHERLKRTIPHKAFESLAMKLPYITSRAEGHSGYLIDGKNCLLVNPEDPDDLARAILELKNNPILAQEIAEAGYELYKKTASPKILAQNIVNFINDAY